MLLVGARLWVCGGIIPNILSGAHRGEDVGKGLDDLRVVKIEGVEDAHGVFITGGGGKETARGRRMGEETCGKIRKQWGGEGSPFPPFRNAAPLLPSNFKSIHSLFYTQLNYSTRTQDRYFAKRAILESRQMFFEDRSPKPLMATWRAVPQLENVVSGQRKKLKYQSKLELKRESHEGKKGIRVTSKFLRLTDLLLIDSVKGKVQLASMDREIPVGGQSSYICSI
ncbi:hypothetical protein H6P81_012379 [Aristolochia fimbriata]|uniref:Uncharacterized protein n=1 Tax=Aristolochia fimbriata TaxID=158543 RepID=A0AAV7EER1_ARIFI|nr:hypothetical protein H6P81_012379 [Aristolochia fimbriata]